MDTPPNSQKQLKSWDWGSLNLKMQCDKGIITAAHATIFPPEISVGPLSEPLNTAISNYLVGRAYNYEAFNVQNEFENCEEWLQFHSWFVQHL